MSVQLGSVWFNYKTQSNLKEIDLKNLDEDVLESINQNYAGTIYSPINGDFFILAFKDVDDHIDGNGLSTLFIKEGSGIFYYDGNPIKMKQNDIILFDDNIDHGFSSDSVCLAINITWGKIIPTIEDVKFKLEKSIDLCNKPNKKMKRF